MRFNTFKKLQIFYDQQKIAFKQFLSQKMYTTLSDQFKTIKQVKKIKWKQHSYPFLNDFFLRFLNSKAHSGFVSGPQVVFITGAQNIGKSKFIKENIDTFKKKKLSLSKKIRQQQQQDWNYLPPETIEQMQKRKYQNQHYILINPKINENISFYGFLNLLEQQIIRQVIAKSQQINNLLSLEILYQILLSQHSQKYIQIYAKDYILGLLTDLELILLDQQSKSKLHDIYQEFMNAKFSCKLIFKDKFIQIVNIIAKYFNNNKLQACIRLFIGITHKIQYQNRPPEYTYSYYRTGIQTTIFLFDIVNFFTGIHKINLQYIQKYFSNKQWSPIKNFIFQGNHIDSALILQDIFKSKCSNDVLFINWFDHLLLRAINQSNLRTHFPIIIQMKCSNQVKDILRFGRMNLENPVIIDIMGYTLGRREDSNLLNIFDNKTIKNIWPYLGNHVELWKRAVNFLMKDENNSLNDLIEGNINFIQKDNIILHAKINKIYTESKIIPFLDDGTLNNRIIQYLQLFLDAKGYLSTMWYRNVVEHIQNPVMECMNEIGITHQQYYYEVCHLKYQTYLYGMKQLVKQMKKNKINYTYWNLMNSIGRKKFKHNYNKEKLNISHIIFTRKIDQFMIHQYYVKPQAYFEGYESIVNETKRDNFN